MKVAIDKKRANLLSNLLLAVVLLTACSMVKGAVAVRIAEGTDIQLITGSEYTELTQKITATFKNQAQVFITETQIDAGKMTLVGLTPTGTQLFSVIFNGINIENWKSPLYTAPFDGAYLLADYQLVNLDLDTLRTTLPQHVLLKEKNLDHGRQRELLRNTNGEVIITINYNAQKTRLCHHERNYCLDIETLEKNHE